MPYDITIILKQLADEDEQAFRQIFDHYKAIFHAIAFKITRSADIAEEVIQEVFVTLWVKRKLIAKAKSPESYLFTILHNCIYSHFRKLAYEHKLKLKWEKEREISEDPIKVLDEKENSNILENIINQLPPQQKLIYKLAKQKGMSREEIAKQLNISPNTVRNHLSAAVEYLRNYFKNGGSVIIWIVIWLHL